MKIVSISINYQQSPVHMGQALNSVHKAQPIRVSTIHYLMTVHVLFKALSDSMEYTEFKHLKTSSPIKICSV